MLFARHFIITIAENTSMDIDTEIAYDKNVISAILEGYIGFCGNMDLEASNLACFLEESTLKVSCKVMWKSRRK